MLFAFIFFSVFLVLVFLFVFLYSPASILGGHCSGGIVAYANIFYPPYRYSHFLFGAYLFVGLVVKASASGAEDPGFESRLRRDFSGSTNTSDLKLALQWLPCQAPGIIGSALGLVCPVSVYYDWVR